MRDGWRGLVLSVLKVPSEPHAPAGSPGSVRVFRAGRNYFRYKAVLWVLRQAAAVFGALAFIAFAGEAIDQGVERSQAKTAAKLEALPPDSPKRMRIERALGWTDSGKDLFTLIEIVGLGFLVVQMPFTFAMVRLDYEMRWYVATDRSLRLREGLVAVREMTLTYANVQNVSIRQGPLQRLLGLSDLVVQTAGGGGSRQDAHGQEAGPSMHEGTLRGVDNAEEIRDLILSHLRRLRDAGLGDPDERPPHPVVGPDDAIAAAREALDAARELRRTLSRA